MQPLHPADWLAAGALHDKAGFDRDSEINRALGRIDAYTASM